MDTALYDALEQALNDLESGTDIDTILASNPQVEAELRPTLDTAQIAYSAGVVDIPQKALNNSRTRLLAHARQLRQEPQSRWLFFRRTPRLIYAFVLTLFFLMSFGGLSIVSAKTLPGDQLYPVKRVVENIRLSLSVSPENHQAMEDLYSARRIDEVKHLLASGRKAFIEFYGRVNHQDADQWNIGGIEVHLTSDTIIIGDIPLGAVVEVEGVTVPEGWVQAAEIHLQTFGFVGYVESISQDLWRIGGSTVLITQDFRIDSGIRVGDWVVVSVRSDDLGNLFAQLIDTSNLATPTVVPTQTDSPIPTTTPILTPLLESDDGDHEIGPSEDLDSEEDKGDDDSELDETEDGDEDIEDSEGDDHEDDEKGEDEEDEKDEEDEDEKGGD